MPGGGAPGGVLLRCPRTRVRPDPHRNRPGRVRGRGRREPRGGAGPGCRCGGGRPLRGHDEPRTNIPAARNRRGHRPSGRRCSSSHRRSSARAEIEAVVATLESGWLTSGPRVAELEERFADYARRRPRDRHLIVHRCAPPGAPGRRRRRRRRGGHELVHVAGHRERDPARRSDPPLRRHRPGHPERRPGVRRGGDHAAHARGRPGALRRRAMRHGRHRGGGQGSRHRDRRGRRPRRRGDGARPQDRRDRRPHVLLALRHQEPRRRRGRHRHHRLRGDGEAASPASRPRDHARPLAPGADQDARPLRRGRAGLEGQPGRPPGGCRTAQGRADRRAPGPPSRPRRALRRGPLCRSPASSRSAGRGTASTPTTSTSSGSTRGWPEPIATRTPRRSWPRTSPPASISCPCTS